MHSQVYIDIGNTVAKWKLNGTFHELPTSEFDLNNFLDFDDIWVSDVSQRCFDFDKSNIHYVTSQAKYKSLTNSYKQPESLGSDRWFAMIACYEYSRDSSFLVIDIGTAITIDVVDSSGSHQGGLIFPGLDKLRQTFDNFPVTSIENINEIGQSTEKAWTVGTLSLLVNTINQQVQEVKKKIPSISVFITGGGYLSMQNFLDFSHVYHENLVLDGLQFYVDYVG